MMRRIPGWPNEDLDSLLIKFKTPYFTAPCGGTDNQRKLSMSKLPYSFHGATCGLCHIVSKFKLFI